MSKEIKLSCCVRKCKIRLHFQPRLRTAGASVWLAENLHSLNKPAWRLLCKTNIIKWRPKKNYTDVQTTGCTCLEVFFLWTSPIWFTSLKRQYSQKNFFANQITQPNILKELISLQFSLTSLKAILTERDFVDFPAHWLCFQPHSI